MLHFNVVSPITCEFETDFMPVFTWLAFVIHFTEELTIQHISTSFVLSFVITISRGNHVIVQYSRTFNKLARSLIARLFRAMIYLSLSQFLFG